MTSRDALLMFLSAAKLVEGRDWLSVRRLDGGTGVRVNYGGESVLYRFDRDGALRLFPAEGDVSGK